MKQDEHKKENPAVPPDSRNHVCFFCVDPHVLRQLQNSRARIN